MLRCRPSEIVLTPYEVSQASQRLAAREAAARSSTPDSESILTPQPRVCRGPERSRDEALVHRFGPVPSLRPHPPIGPYRYGTVLFARTATDGDGKDAEEGSSMFTQASERVRRSHRDDRRAFPHEDDNEALNPGSSGVVKDDSTSSLADRFSSHLRIDGASEQPRKSTALEVPEQHLLRRQLTLPRSPLYQAEAVSPPEGYPTRIPSRIPSPNPLVQYSGRRYRPAPEGDFPELPERRVHSGQAQLALDELLRAAQTRLGEETFPLANSPGRFPKPYEHGCIFVDRPDHRFVSPNLSRLTHMSPLTRSADRPLASRDRSDPRFSSLERRRSFHGRDTLQSAQYDGTAAIGLRPPLVRLTSHSTPDLGISCPAVDAATARLASLVLAGSDESHSVSAHSDSPPSRSSSPDTRVLEMLHHRHSPLERLEQAASSDSSRVPSIASFHTATSLVETTTNHLQLPSFGSPEFEHHSRRPCSPQSLSWADDDNLSDFAMHVGEHTRSRRISTASSTDTSAPSPPLIASASLPSKFLSNPPCFPSSPPAAQTSADSSTPVQPHTARAEPSVQHRIMNWQGIPAFHPDASRRRTPPGVAAPQSARTIRRRSSTWDHHTNGRMPNLDILATPRPRQSTPNAYSASTAIRSNRRTAPPRSAHDGPSIDVRSPRVVVHTDVATAQRGSGRVVSGAGLRASRSARQRRDDQENSEETQRELMREELPSVQWRSSVGERMDDTPPREGRFERLGRGSGL